MIGCNETVDQDATAAAIAAGREYGWQQGVLPPGTAAAAAAATPVASFSGVVQDIVDQLLTRRGRHRCVLRDFKYI
eukprot:COSAG06_NODE_4023_length_4652_cov_2.267077_3_plen_76_part_00